MTVKITPHGTRGFKAPAAFRPLARLHARLYKLVGGRGHRNMVVLTTLGSKSGQERSSTVASFPEGEGAWLVVASMGGEARHPSWYMNLAKNPDHVFLQVRGERFRVQPVSLHGPDRAAAWKRITSEMPNFAEYQTKTDREIPVVRLTRKFQVAASFSLSEHQRRCSRHMIRPATRPGGALGKRDRMSIRGRLAKVGFACLIGAAISATMVPLSAVAIAPVGNFVLYVTDCATGQPITIGEAYFSAHVGTAVLPIENGTAGPAGLGDLKFVLTVTSPGYRPLQRVLQGTGPTGPVRNIPLCLHAVAGSPVHAVTTSYNIDITCTGSGQVCDPIYSTNITSADVLRLQFTAASTNCSAITLVFQEDGFDVYYSDQLGPGDSTPAVNVGPVIPGTHVLTVQATGVEGGCNVGTLDSWGGTLTLVTVLPVGPTTKGQCIDGGWSGFSAFRNEGACINYVVTAGKHA